MRHNAMRQQLFVALVAVAAMGVSAAASAAPLFSRAKSIDDATLARDASWQALIANPATARATRVEVDARQVASDTPSLTLDIDGFSVDAWRLDSYVDDAGNLVWSGLVEDTTSKLLPQLPSYHGEQEIAGDPSNQVLIVRHGDRLTGSLWIDGALYRLRPLTSGGHALAAVDLSKMPADHPPSYASLAAVPMKAADATKANTVIRVMVNYTPGAASQAGDISGLISLAVAESNQGYANSGVAITMQLANASQVSYTETGNFDTDLLRYRRTNDGYMDGIHTTRNNVAADVGVLIVKNTAYCGLASGIGSTASTAFAEVYWDCATGYYSFAHEVGHLQSARHDPANDPTNTPYAYGHGYQYPSGGWRTIMAYACSSANCTRLNYWSNPGVTRNGVPMGTAAKHDNHRVLNNTAATIAGFR